MPSSASDDLFKKIGTMFAEAGGFYQTTGPRPKKSAQSSYEMPYGKQATGQPGKPFDTMNFDDEEEAQVRRPVTRPGGVRPAARQNAMGLVCCFTISILMFVMFFLFPE